MDKYVFRTIILFLFTTATVFAQAKVQTDTVIIYTHCPPMSIPQIEVDSIVIADVALLESPPRPTAGLIGIRQLVKYPELARRARLEGKVSVQAVVDKKGTATDVRVHRSDSQVFDEACVTAIRAATFEPARYHGSAVEAKIIVPFVFSFRKKYEIREEQPPNVSEISLSHGSGMLIGPTYNIVLRKDGTAAYVGKTHVDLLGTYEGKFSPSYFKKIEALLSWLCLLDSTPDAPTIAMDATYDVISVVRDGKKERIETSDQDERIWGLARIIDQIATEIKWEKPKNAPEKER